MLSEKITIRKVSQGSLHPERAHFKNISTLLFFLFSLSLVSTASAQNKKLNISPASHITIAGTSSLHDWESEAKEISGELFIDKNLLTRIKEGARIQSIELRINVKSIESGRAGMDKRTHEALKWETHPKVIVSIPLAEIINIENDASFIALATGTLTIAGVVQPIEMEVEGAKNENGAFRFSGKKQINMRDFDIEPPTAMFGQIVTGEEVNISFNLLTETVKP